MGVTFLAEHFPKASEGRSRQKVISAAERGWWTSLARFLLPLGLALSLFTLPAFAAPVVWVAPSLARVKPMDPAGSATQIDLFAARGEYESFQIIVRAPAGGLTNVTASPPDLGGPELALYREHYVYLTRGTTDWYTNQNKPLGPGWYPDGLIPFVDPATGDPPSAAALTAVPFSLAAGSNQPIWVDVYVPRTTAPGDYSGVFTIASDQGQASVGLNLRVWDFALPRQPALRSCFLYWDVRRQTQPDQELLKHRLMPISIDRTNERNFIDNLGLNGTNLGFWSGADSSAGTMPPAPSVITLQQAAASHQRDLYLYNYTADEIGSDTSLHASLKQWAYNLHQAGIDNLVTMAPAPELYDDGSGTGRSAVDIWVMLPKMYDRSPSQVDFVLAKGDKAWSYNCLVQDDYSPKWEIDFAPINYRIQTGFINQSLGLSGLLYWRADLWSSDPWNSVEGYSPTYPGEGMLVYPGAQVGVSGVVASMRLKYLRDGADDYDYIQLLKDEGLGDWALSVARTVGPDWSNWTRDPDLLETARRLLGDALDSLGTPHSLSVSATASPATIPDNSTTQLTATATDSLGHAISYVWTDNAWGGSFSPSPNVQNPTYWYPTASADRQVPLTVTATCSGGLSQSDSLTLTVQPQTQDALQLSASANPATVASGGSSLLSASATDSLGHSVTWSWDDGGAGGSFSPSASVQNPTYTAPENSTTETKTVALTVAATSDGDPPATGRAFISLPVLPLLHTVTVTASAAPSTIPSGGSTSLSASAIDSEGHGGLAWSWSDNEAGGTFSPSNTVPDPTYTAPPNDSGDDETITLTASATCRWYSPWVTGTAEMLLTVRPPLGPRSKPGLRRGRHRLPLRGRPLRAVFSDVPPDHWAYDYIMDCYHAGIVNGYPGNVYLPDAKVTRAQMALYIARALVGGAANVPAGPAEGTFPDVPPDHWAYDAVEYAVAAAVVGWYPSGTYEPDWVVTRSQMAVFVARSIVDPTGEEGLDGYTPPLIPSFTDVAADHWSFKHVEYCAEKDVVLGYPDASYRPALEITRAQMAVYIAEILNP